MGGSLSWQHTGRTGMTQGRKITVIVLVPHQATSVPL
jgi:hypothetical protein